MTKLFMTTATALALGTAAFAGGHAADENRFKAYAAMAKLEANKAEAAGAVILALMPGASDQTIEEAREDFESDVSQLEGYVNILMEMPLTEGQKASVMSFSEEWGAAVDQARTLLDSDDAADMEVVMAWWEGLDDLDDLIDDELEAILEVEGIEFAD